MNKTRRTNAAAGALAFGLALALPAIGALAGDFEGVWKVTDTGGKAFEITLSEDGKASATREGEGMKGTWKEVGDSVAITWDTGWTTVIAKDGDKYTKTAFGKGKPLDGPPDNSSPAEKVK